MTHSQSHKPRPRAGDGSSTGIERYRLLKAAFKHAEIALCEGRYLEAIAILDSLLTDRLGSLVHGSLGCPVTLNLTLGNLITLAKSNKPVTSSLSPRIASAKTGTRAPLPDDVISFLRARLSNWGKERNNAVHGMAKLHAVGDGTFDERYSRLAPVALDGIRVLLELDIFDQREKKRNGAGHSATWPDALKLRPEVARKLSTTTTQVGDLLPQAESGRGRGGKLGAGRPSQLGTAPPAD